MRRWGDYQRTCLDQVGMERWLWENTVALGPSEPDEKAVEGTGPPCGSELALPFMAT